MAPWQKVLASALVGFGSASLVGAEEQSGQCQGILEKLEAKNDFELQALCRAEFSPGACRDTLRSLGARPWGKDQLEATCQRFVAVTPSSEVKRVLQEAQSVDDLSAKTTTVAPSGGGDDVDTSLVDKTTTVSPARGKNPVHPVAQSKDEEKARGGVLGGLLAKLKPPAAPKPPPTPKPLELPKWKPPPMPTLPSMPPMPKWPKVPPMPKAPPMPKVPEVKLPPPPPTVVPPMPVPPHTGSDGKHPPRSDGQHPPRSDGQHSPRSGTYGKHPPLAEDAAGSAGQHPPRTTRTPGAGQHPPRTPHTPSVEVAKNATADAHAAWKAAHATQEVAKNATADAHAAWKAAHATQEKFELPAAAAVPASRFGPVTTGVFGMAVAAMAAFGVTLVVHRLRRRRGSMVADEEDDLMASLEKQPEIAE